MLRVCSFLVTRDFIYFFPLPLHKTFEREYRSQKICFTSVVAVKPRQRSYGYNWERSWRQISGRRCCSVEVSDIQVFPIKSVSIWISGFPTRIGITAVPRKYELDSVFRTGKTSYSPQYCLLSSRGRGINASFCVVFFFSRWTESSQSKNERKPLFAV